MISSLRAVASFRTTIPFTPDSTPALAPPPQLGEKGRAGFTDYLSASPHNAFAVSPRGAFAYRGGRRSAREAADDTLAACAMFAPDCALYAVDDKLVDQPGTRLR